MNYIVLIHGYPVSNGTLIWRQSLTSVSKAVEKYTYDGSSADIYLTGVFYSSLDPYIQENIIPANIVYRDGYKGYRTINRTVFLCLNMKRAEAKAPLRMAAKSLT